MQPDRPSISQLIAEGRHDEVLDRVGGEPEPSGFRWDKDPTCASLEAEWKRRQANLDAEEPAA